ncbi:MAG: bactofilin family protein [Candidatus Omnitrophota bacterium]
MAFFTTKNEDKRKDESPAALPHHHASIEKPSPSYVGRTMTVEGDLTSEDDVTIEGTVTGNIVVQKMLTIGLNGNVKADIKAGTVRIIGEAKGKIIASEKVEILSTGRYTGSIQSEKLIIAEGAFLNGEINEQAGGNSSK